MFNCLLVHTGYKSQRPSHHFYFISACDEPSCRGAVPAMQRLGPRWPVEVCLALPIYTARLGPSARLGCLLFSLLRLSSGSAFLGCLLQLS